MFINLIPPSIKTPPDDDHLIKLAQRLRMRINDETLWAALGGSEGLRLKCRDGARLADSLCRSELPKMCRKLRWLSFCLYAVSLYCICVEAPLKAGFLPKLGRRAAWKAVLIHAEMGTLYDVAIE